jgi:hypothetical protein
MRYFCQRVSDLGVYRQPSGRCPCSRFRDQRGDRGGDRRARAGLVGGPARAGGLLRAAVSQQRPRTGMVPPLLDAAALRDYMEDR